MAAWPLCCQAQKWQDPRWAGFSYPEVDFYNQAAGTKGAAIYQRLVPQPVDFIQQHALWVAQTLYWSAGDAIPQVRKIRYDLKDADGISSKNGAPPNVGVFFSSRWVEKSAANGASDDAVLAEARGVLYHELAHAYQLEPKGIGSYKQGTEFWAFIEGMADAVRIHHGFLPISSRKPGGNWMDGYRTTGFFLDWLTSKDPDFLRKFNRSTQEVIPWSFDKAMKRIFGDRNGVKELWDEYQAFLKMS